MACPSCNFKGFIETDVMKDNGSRPIVKQCVVCKDTARYSKEIQRRLRVSNVGVLGQVIPFPKKEKP